VIDVLAAHGAYLADRGEYRAAALAEASVGSTMIDFFYGGATARAAAEDGLTFALSPDRTPQASGPGGERLLYELSEVRLLPPVPRPTSLRDYSGYLAHMDEFLSGLGLPAVDRDVFERRPMYFKGNAGTVVGSDDVVAWPSLGERLDFEIELAMFVGKPGRDLVVAEAESYIAGYTILNDFSLRDVQEREMSLGVNIWGLSKSKDAPGYAVGPCVVTPDELDVADLALIVRVNGEEWVRERTDDMTWSFAELVATSSQGEPIAPGDLIAGGSPPRGYGAALGRWIGPGDVVECEVPGIGVLRNTIGPRT
jgi:2-keto-4-pentenoate hydratase/2-oxohepta-3-ene-1,7-dioic acid hydratase in catechol pathway